MKILFFHSQNKYVSVLIIPNTNILGMQCIKKITVLRNNLIDVRSTHNLMVEVIYYETQLLNRLKKIYLTFTAVFIRKI